jgi:glycosyltransferase involved in cell wall biosynthesis
MTVGRVEPDKGIFALLEAARISKEKLGRRVRFDVCGTGSALEEARRRVVGMGLQETMTLHGWTSMEDMARLWGESHVAVVPTTSDFVEGFNQVVIEAVLAGRPVITSRVCPALEYVRPCAIEVDVDDVEGYAHAIVDLANNREKYGKLQNSTRDVVKQFLDPGKSFGAAVEHVLRGIAVGQEVSPVSHPPDF